VQRRPAGGHRRAWDNPPALPPQALDDPRTSHVVEPASAALAGLREHDHWGFKDPRLCLTAAFWLDLQPDLRFIVCIRHPSEVALSLKRRNQTSYSLGLALWERYYATILELVPPERRIVTHYDSLFDDPDGELARLCAFAGSTPASLFVRTDLRHHTVGVGLGEAAVSRSLVDLYRALSREAGVVLPREAPVDEGRVRRMILDGAVAQRHAEQRQAAIDRLQERSRSTSTRIRQLERELTSAKLEAGTRAKALHASMAECERTRPAHAAETCDLRSWRTRRAALRADRRDRRPTRAVAARVETVVSLSQPSMARRAMRRWSVAPSAHPDARVASRGRRLAAGLAARSAGAGRRPPAVDAPADGSRRCAERTPRFAVRHRARPAHPVVGGAGRPHGVHGRGPARQGSPPPAATTGAASAPPSGHGRRPAVSRRARAVGPTPPPPAQRVVERGRRSMRRSLPATAVHAASSS
jgi:hypothetical protein